MVDFTDPESTKKYVISAMQAKAAEWKTRTLVPEDIDEDLCFPSIEEIKALFGMSLIEVIIEAGLLPWYFDEDFSSIQFSGPEETKLYILLALQQKAAEEGVQKFWPREIKRDPRFPPVKEILELFDVRLLDDVLRLAGLLPAHPNKDELIATLKAFYDEYGRAPSVRDADMGLLEYSRHIYTDRFDSWNAGLMAAGLPTIEAVGGWNASIGDWSETPDEEIIGYFRRVYGDKKSLPSVEAYVAEYKRDKHPYPLELIKKRFKGWHGLSERTKLKLQSDKRSMQVTKHEVLEYFRKRYGVTRRLPTLTEYEQSNPKYSYHVICRLFGGFIGLARQLDYQIARPEYIERCINRRDRAIPFD